MSKRNTPSAAYPGGAGQRACTVPMSTPNAVIHDKLYSAILAQGQKDGNARASHTLLSSRPLKQTRLPASFVKVEGSGRRLPHR